MTALCKIPPLDVQQRPEEGIWTWAIFMFQTQEEYHDDKPNIIIGGLGSFENAKVYVAEKLDTRVSN